MSKHISLALHYPEEIVNYKTHEIIANFPGKIPSNPISDYFESTNSLLRKIIRTEYASDSEILGLLVLGIISNTEFYFRSVLSKLGELCPICIEHMESISIPVGSFSYYPPSGFSPAFSAFEHKSLANSKEISSEVERFSNLKCTSDSSVKTCLQDFEILCEIRHCLVHSRGFLSLKAAKAMRTSRKLHKILIRQDQALELTKISHNIVRALNRFLAEGILNRWIENDTLSGSWRQDKTLFSNYFKLFAKQGEDEYFSSAREAYRKIQPILRKRKAAITARVVANNAS